MKIKILILFITLFSNFKIIACECTIIKYVNEEISSSDYVAVGKVIGIEKIFLPDSVYIKQQIKSGHSIDKMSKINMGRYLNKITLKISRVYKGVENDKIQTIYTGAGGGDCGFYFEQNKRYLIYANMNSFITKELLSSNDSFKNVLSTNICKRTKKYNRKEVRQIKRFI